MHPILFHIGDFAVPSYGAALSLSFAVGIYVAMGRARRRGLDGEAVLTVSMWIILASIVGARLFFVALHFEEFQQPEGTLWDIVRPVRSADGRLSLSGASTMGALPASLLAAVVVMRWKRLSPLPYMDIMAPSVALGAAITRIGCFLNGCCFGTVCTSSFGVTYPPGSIPVAVSGGAALHATPLYHAAAAVAIFVVLLALARRRPFDGVIVSALFALMGLQRVVIEFFRYNDALWTVDIGSLQMSPHQVSALILLLAGCVAAGWFHRMRLREAAD